MAGTRTLHHSVVLSFQIDLIFPINDRWDVPCFFQSDSPLYPAKETCKNVLPTQTGNIMRHVFYYTNQPMGPMIPKKAKQENQSDNQLNKITT